MTDDDSADGWIDPSRRQVLGGAAALAAAGLGASTASGDHPVDTSGGSTTAAERTMHQTQGLYIGPVELAAAVESAPDELFVAVDARPPRVHDPQSGTLSHSVVAEGSGLPAYVADDESDLSDPGATPAFAVTENQGLRVTVPDGSFSSGTMTQAQSIHVAAQQSDLPTPSSTPAIAVTRDEGVRLYR